MIFLSGYRACLLLTAGRLQGIKAIAAIVGVAHGEVALRLQAIAAVEEVGEGGPAVELGVVVRAEGKEARGDDDHLRRLRGELMEEIVAQGGLYGAFACRIRVDPG